MEAVREFVSQPVTAFFLIVALGAGLGSIRIAGITLGASGVLFTALLFGHFDVQLPPSFQDLGTILFVYAIGLQAGPRFFNQFRHRGFVFAKVGILVIITGAAMTWVLTWLLELDPALAIGMYAGAMTSTPGLAAAMDAAQNPTVSVGYGLAYPLGIIGVVLLVQLLPRFFKVNLKDEERRLREHDSKESGLDRRQFVVRNPACSGKTLAELEFRQLTEVNVTRILRQGKVSVAIADSKLELGDVVVAVGRQSELDKLTILFGEESFGEEIFETTDIVSRDITISTDQMVGKTLAELKILKNYGIIVSRVFREDLDFVPTGRYVMEIGDLLRIVGSRDDCNRFVEEAGQQEKRIYETNIATLSLGIFLGVLLAYKEFHLPGGAVFRLGLAGGPLLVSLVLSHFGRIGNLNVRTPRGAKYIMQQLGLVLFLAAAGTAAGGSLAEVIAESGVMILLAGAAITLTSALIGCAAAFYVFRQDFLTVLGVVCGSMTSTPALGVVSGISDRPESILAYTAVYPVAMILIAVVCQFLYFLL
jgi:putative transport protein